MKFKFIGIRPVKKLEKFFYLQESEHVFDFGDYYIIQPQIRFNKKLIIQKTFFLKKAEK